MRSSTNRFLPVLTLLLTAAMWSLGGALIKLVNGHGSGLPPAAITCYRSLLAGVFFLPFALRHRGSLRSVPGGWPLASVLSFTLMTASFVAATTQTAAANAIVLQYTAPIWVFALSPLLLKERPQKKEGIVLSIAMCGVLVILLSHPPGGATAVLLALASGLGFGLITIVLRGLRPVNPMVVVCMNCLCSGVLMSIFLLGSGSGGASFIQPTTRQWELLLLLAMVQFALPYILFSWALQRIEAHRASLIVLLEPILNPVWTYLVVGEPVPRATLLGGPLILAGVAGWVLLTWQKERGDKPAE